MKRLKSQPVDPRPIMPRGENDFEEARMKTDFLAVFKRISDSYWDTVMSPVEYAYRAGYIAGKSRRELDIKGSHRLPTYIKIL